MSSFQRIQTEFFINGLWSTTNAATALMRVVDGQTMVLAMRPGEADIIASTAVRCYPDTCHITVIRPRADANGDGFADVEDPPRSASSQLAEAIW